MLFLKKDDELKCITEDDLIDPGTEISSTETVCGTATMTERQLYTLAKIYFNDNKIASEHTANVLIEIFWYSIFQRIDNTLLNEHDIGIRSNWKIVIFNRQAENTNIKYFQTGLVLGASIFLNKQQPNNTICVN